MVLFASDAESIVKATYQNKLAHRFGLLRTGLHDSLSFSTARAHSPHAYAAVRTHLPLPLLAPCARCIHPHAFLAAVLCSQVIPPTSVSSHGRRPYVWMSLHPVTSHLASSVAASMRRLHPALCATELRAAAELIRDLHVPPTRSLHAPLPMLPPHPPSMRR
jgi:hypothetical protein